MKQTGRATTKRVEYEENKPMGHDVRGMRSKNVMNKSCVHTECEADRSTTTRERRFRDRASSWCMYVSSVLSTELSRVSTPPRANVGATLMGQRSCLLSSSSIKLSAFLVPRLCKPNTSLIPSKQMNPSLLAASGACTGRLSARTHGQGHVTQDRWHWRRVSAVGLARLCRLQSLASITIHVEACMCLLSRTEENGVSSGVNYCTERMRPWPNSTNCEETDREKTTVGSSHLDKKAMEEYSLRCATQPKSFALCCLW